MRGMIAASVVFLLVGCGSSQPAPVTEPPPATESAPAPEAAAPAPAAPAGFSFGGSLASEVPAGAELYIVWVVWTGSPDRAFNAGEATLADGNFRVTLAGAEPPPEVINDMTAGGMGRLAIGMLAVMAPGTALPAGEITDRSGFMKGLIGLSARHAIIWRDGEFAGDKLTWPSQFAAGTFACGACAPGEGTFDGFTPADCAEVAIQVAPLNELEICNYN